MPKNNAYLSTSDPFTIKVYDSDETIDMFGEDQLEESGIYIPEELLARYKKCYEEFWLIQTQLKAFKKEQDEK